MRGPDFSPKSTMISLLVGQIVGKKEFFMKNRIKLFLIIAMVAVMSSLTGCMTYSSVGSTSDPQGLISQADVVRRGATEIGSYSVYLGLFTQGYDFYVNDVREAIAEGKEVSSITTWYVFFTTTRAYAREPGSQFQTRN